MEEPFAVCISGHRPEKLPQGNALRMMLSLMYQEIRSAAEDGADRFYVGMARGTDLWAAEMILHFRFQYPALRLICVLPDAQSGSPRQSGAERYQFRTLLHAADHVICLAPHYYRGCYRARNEYMIRHSRRLIAMMTDSRSGTGQTVRMAEKAGLDVRLITLPRAEQQEHPAHEYFKF